MYLSTCTAISYVGRRLLIDFWFHVLSGLGIHTCSGCYHFTKPKDLRPRSAGSAHNGCCRASGSPCPWLLCRRLQNRSQVYCELSVACFSAWGWASASPPRDKFGSLHPGISLIGSSDERRIFRNAAQVFSYLCSTDRTSRRKSATCRNNDEIVRKLIIELKFSKVLVQSSLTCRIISYVSVPWRPFPPKGGSKARPPRASSLEPCKTLLGFVWVMEADRLADLPRY